ncbi:MAG: DoxX family protein [Woeseiaceae bacterium]|nr:DoxX family protein [Woeseiaceae bacterium]
MRLKKPTIKVLDPARDWFMLLPIRLLMAYEFITAGIIKLNGNNWFANYQDNFLFPFNYISVEISWFMTIWTEILGGLGLLFGFFTRFWALSLIIVSIVTISGMHWPDNWDNLSELWKGYTVIDKGFGDYRIQLLFIAMLIPLVFNGAGKLSIDSAHSSKKGI